MKSGVSRFAFFFFFFQKFLDSNMSSRSALSNLNTNYNSNDTGDLTGLLKKPNAAASNAGRRQTLAVTASSSRKSIGRMSMAGGASNAAAPRMSLGGNRYVFIFRFLWFVVEKFSR